MRLLLILSGIFLAFATTTTTSSSAPGLGSLPLDAPVSTGTTLVAARYGGGEEEEGGIIVGADSRTSRSGYVSNRYAQKLSVVSSNIVVARSGSAADTQHLVEELTLELLELERSRSSESLSLPRVSTAAHILRRRSYANKDALSASLLCAGWDPVRGLQIYNIPKGGTLMPSSSFALAGSGSTFVYGWCDRCWRADMTREECIEFVGHALELAMGRDGSSGGRECLIEIAPGGGCRHI